MNKKTRPEQSRRAKQLLINLILPIISAVAVAGLAYAAWTEPGTTPPGNNVDAPINVSGDTQYKLGALGIGGLFETDIETHLARLGGNVGIGTANPNKKLDVTGDIHATGDVCTDLNGGKCLSSGGGGGDYVKFAGYSDPTMGNAGRLAGMNAKCAAKFPTKSGVRICTDSEVLSLWVRGELPHLGDGKQAWFQSAELGVSILDHLSCRDWSSSQSSQHAVGVCFNSYLGGQYISSCYIVCSAAYPIACCY